MLKIDVLALDTLSCIRKAFELLRSHYGVDLDLARLPARIRRSTRCCRKPTRSAFPGREPGADVDAAAAEAALLLRPGHRGGGIVPPGPIQGDMIDPYLCRREGNEPVMFRSAELEAVLGRMDPGGPGYSRSGRCGSPSSPRLHACPGRRAAPGDDLVPTPRPYRALPADADPRHGRMRRRSGL
jgi:hypothetical protein